MKKKISGKGYFCVLENDRTSPLLRLSGVTGHTPCTGHMVCGVTVYTVGGHSAVLNVCPPYVYKHIPPPLKSTWQHGH